MLHNEKRSTFLKQENNDVTTWELPEGAIGRFGQGRHCKVALSANKQHFVVGTLVGLWWYDISSETPIALWETERGMISALDFSPNGEWIAVANWDGIVKVLDVHTGECLGQMKRIQEQNIYWHLTFSQDAKLIATANWQGVVEVLDVPNSKCIAQMDRGEREEISADIYRLEFSPNGDYVAATADNLGKEGTQTYVWRTETGELIFKFAGSNFSFSQDGCLLAGVTSDRSINHNISVWNVATNERIFQTRLQSDWIDTIIFSPCSKYIAFCSRDQNLTVCNISSDRKKNVYPEIKTERTVLYYSQDGTLYAVVDGEINVEVWNVETDEKLPIPNIESKSIEAKWVKEFPQLAISDIILNKKHNFGENIHQISKFSRYDNVPQPVIFLPDGKTLASTSERRGITLWDIESKQARETLVADKRITSFHVSPCGNIFGASIKANEDYGCVWDVAKPDQPIAEFNEKAQLIWKIAFTPTGDRLAVGSREGTIFHWDISKNKELKPFIGHNDYIWSICCSADGRRLASGSSDKTVRLWDMETSDEIATLPLEKSRTLMSLAFSPNGQVIAGGMFREIRLWCTDSFKTLLAIPQNQGECPYALAFSPCGRYLASGTWWEKGMDKMAIMIWDVTNGKNITTFWGHPTDIQSLAFSPDGTILASGSFDGTIMLWDLKRLI